MTGTNMVTDVRIVVEGLNDVRKVCEALAHSSMGSDYGASITSIIPTTDPFIAVNSASGADIVIVAMDADGVGRNLSDEISEALLGVCPIVESVRLPNGQNVEYYDSLLLRDSIEKAIIRSGLKALRLLQAGFEKGLYPEDVEDSNIAELSDDSYSPEEGADYVPEADMEETVSPSSESDYDAISWMPPIYEDDDNEEAEEASEEDENAIYEANQLRMDNQKYLGQIADLENRLNDLMINSFEKYNIKEVWESLYSEQVPAAEELSLAASRLSDDIYVSNNFIFAQSLSKVEDFLKEFRETFN